jgi:hypothetical protein
MKRAMEKPIKIDIEDAVALHLAQTTPSRWSAMILDMANENPHTARLAADMVRCKQIDDGFQRSPLCLVATATIETIDRRLGNRQPLGGPVRASRDFYLTAVSWTATGGKPFTPA